MRRAALVALAGLLAAAVPAAAAPPLVSTVAPPAKPGPVEVVPGMAYQRLVEPGPQVLHVIRVRLGPLMGLQPVLTGGSLTARGTLTSAMRARLDGGAIAGINGDFFNFAQGFPSGGLEIAGQLLKEPEPSRSALVIDPSGALSVMRLALAGRWQAIDPALPLPFPVRTFIGLNRPSQRGSEGILYTPAFGTATPRGPSRFEALVAVDGGAVPAPNAVLSGTVLSTGSGGGTPIGPGQVVLTGVGSAGPAIASDLVPGRRVTISLGLPGVPPGTASLIGGGPALVQNGVATPSAGEGFTPSQIDPPSSRTAIGQTADGTIIMVVAEGPQQGSRGITTSQQAALMASLGTRTAIAFDSGGSAMMALGDTLVTPWADERPISDALILSYLGVQLTPPLASRLSPNGDRVDDTTSAVVRAAVPGQVRVTLDRRGGGTGPTVLNGPLGPGSRALDVNPARLRVGDGPYRLRATFTPADGSAPSTDSRPLVIDRTVARLRLRPEVRRVGRRPSASLQVSFRLLRPARVTVDVQDSAGRTLRVLRAGRSLRRGSHTVLWDRTLHRKPAPAGTYRIVVLGRTFLGQAGLAATIGLRPPPKPSS
jgi:phosphodiester glycosidase